MACGMSWTLAGSVRIEAGCMVVMRAAVCLAHGIYVTVEIASPGRSNRRVAQVGGASRNACPGSGRTIKARNQLTGRMSNTSGKWG
jgi:hypothetical protein